CGCVALALCRVVVGESLLVASAVSLPVPAFGDFGGRPPVLRSGAKPGEQVAVSGHLGAAAAALQLLFTEAVDESGEPDARRAAALRERTPAQLAPMPPIGDGVLAAIGGATAMLDLSDGLAIDSGRLGKASGVGLDFESDLLGADVALALGGGEDHS